MKPILITEEIWRDIKEYETLYQVSNFGNVKSLSKLSKKFNVVNGTIDFVINNQTWKHI